MNVGAFHPHPPSSLRQAQDPSAGDERPRKGYNAPPPTSPRAARPPTKKAPIAKRDSRSKHFIEQNSEDDEDYARYIQSRPRGKKKKRIPQAGQP